MCVGYDGVTVAQIADEADVSITTLFKHVPDGKPALMFDDETEHQRACPPRCAITPRDTSVLTALRVHGHSRGVRHQQPPALRRYWSVGSARSCHSSEIDRGIGMAG